MKTRNEKIGETANVQPDVDLSEDYHINQEPSDIEYTASLLKQLKMIADQSGHRMLYHLINMAQMEANSILQEKENNLPTNKEDVDKAH